MQLDDVIEAIEDAMKRIDEDERFHYEPANVFSNAVLALIQADLNAQMRAYKQVLFLLQKLKEGTAEGKNEKVISLLKRYQNSIASSREKCDEDERELWDRIDEAIKEAQG